MSNVIKTKVFNLMSTETQSLPESVIVERIIADLQGDIIEVLRSDAKYRVVIEQKGFGGLMQRILSILR